MKYQLSTSEAIDLLPTGKTIHTFMSPTGGVLIGADWDSEDVVKLVTECETQLSGSMAKGMKHGMAAFKPNVGFIFIETNMNKLEELESNAVKQLQKESK